MIFTAHADGRFELGAHMTRCALGRGGIVSAEAKREGDGATPAGVWPLRRVLYRSDRGPRPTTDLPVQPISLEDGWCDDAASPDYNRLVRLPHAASHERLWREDHLYDLVVVLAHNDDPPVPGRGSAIFLHLARDDQAPTEGCVALSRPDLERVLALAERDSALAVVRD